MCAKLPQPTGGSGLTITELAPDGQHIATCLRVVDLFGVERPKFNNPQEKELVDVTRFIFGLVGPDGREYIVQTYEFNISAAPGANLMKFLKMWLGRDAAIGWDYAEMKGQGAMITVARKESKTKRGVFYTNITGIAPVFPALLPSVQPAQRFEAKLQAIERAANQAQTGGANTPPPPPGPTSHYPATPPPPPPARQRQLSPDGKYELNEQNQWVPVAPATPPPAPVAPPPPPTPAPAPVAPPPPPAFPPAPVAPPPPPLPAAAFLVHNNGQNIKVDATGLATMVRSGQGALPAIREGDTAWSTVAALAGQNLDEDVPF